MPRGHTCRVFVGRSSRALLAEQTSTRSPRSVSESFWWSRVDNEFSSSAESPRQAMAVGSGLPQIKVVAGRQLADHDARVEGQLM